MADERVKRQQTQTERDLDGLAARRERARSPALGIVVRSPVASWDDGATDTYEIGPELDAARERRSDTDRIKALEKNADEERTERKTLTTKVDALTVEVTGMRSQLATTNLYLPQLLDALKGKADAAVTIAKDNNETKRLGMTTRAKIVLGIVGAIVTAIGALVGSLAGRA